MAELGTELTQSEYLQGLFVSASLQRQFLPGVLATEADKSPTNTAVARFTPVFPSFSTTVHGTIGYLSSGWPVAYLVATVIFGIGLLISAHVYVSQPVQVAKQSVSFPSPLSPLPSVVGRITGMVDCKWETKGLGVRDWGLEEGPKSKVQGSEEIQSLIPNPQSLVSLGDRFALRSGLMEITYETGAKVILQGPVTYEVESPRSGYLSLGKLVARVDGSGAGRRARGERTPDLQVSQLPSPKSLLPAFQRLPLFSVRTPTATVIDLGTEFGVEVDKRGGTATRVFVGGVNVVLAGEQTGEARSSVLCEQDKLPTSRERMSYCIPPSIQMETKRCSFVFCHSPINCVPPMPTPMPP